jgi:hypothetical protein
MRPSIIFLELVLSARQASLIRLWKLTRIIKEVLAALSYRDY